MPSSPVLTDARFQAEMPHDQTGAQVAVQGATMTVGGTLTATGVLFAIILAAGWFGWGQVEQTNQIVVDRFGNDVLDAAGNQTFTNTTTFPSWLIIAMLVGLGVGLVTAFKPKIARPPRLSTRWPSELRRVRSRRSTTRATTASSCRPSVPPSGCS